MDQISLNCTKCKQPLKFPAGRAGTKAKCTRCGTDLTVPNGTPAPPTTGFEEDDGPMTYGLMEVAQEKKKTPEEKKKEKSKSAIEKRKKTIKNASSWAVVRHGLMLMYLGAMIWLGIYAIYLLMLLLGATAGPEYNVLRLKVLVGDDPDNPPPPDIPGKDDMGISFPNLCKFGIALVAGEKYLTLAWTVQILLALATLVQIAFFMMGYFTCLAVPERFGAKGQVKWMIIMAIVNATIVVVFRLLALLGISYVILPYLVPEIPTLEANIERMTPIHLSWAWVPFLDILLTLIFICCQWSECVLGAVFIRTVGMSIKDEQLKESGTGLVHLALGVAFIFIAYHIISLNGASDVLVSVMRLVYLLAAGFQLLFIVMYMQLLMRTHTTLNGLLEGWDPSQEDEEGDDDDDDDEDDDDEPKRKKSKKRRAEEDEDDDDDDEEDRKPRKGKRR